MSQDIRVALLIGKNPIDASEMPEPFNRMAGYFDGTSDTDATETIIVGDYSITLTFVSIKGSLHEIKRLEDYLRSKGYHENDRNRYILAVEQIIGTRQVSPTPHLRDLDPHLIFIGMTEVYENIVAVLATDKKYSLFKEKVDPPIVQETFFEPLLIRFSPYYPGLPDYDDISPHPGPPMYMNRKPEHIGYDLDMYNSIAALNRFLRNEKCLRSILNRDRGELSEALIELHRESDFIDHPILFLR